MHGKAKFVLDKYHMNHYIISATSHLGDSAQDARSEIWRAINGKRKKDAAEAFDHILADLPTYSIPYTQIKKIAALPLSVENFSRKSVNMHKNRL